MGGPQISAPLSHGHVTGRGQWHRQYLNQLHCSSAIRGEASRRGSYWRQGQALWGEGERWEGEKGVLRMERGETERGGGGGEEKKRRKGSCCLTMEISADWQFVLNNKWNV